MADLVVVGGGFVGLTTAIVLAEQGNRTTLVEIDPKRRELIRQAKPPFYEPGVDDALRDAMADGRLRLGEDLAGAAHADATFLCVGTPSGADGAIDLGAITAATTALGKALANGTRPHVVVVKSTVVPGTADTVVLPTLMRAAGGRAGLTVASNPEFLREGVALHDSRHPDRIVVGCDDAATASRVADLFGPPSVPRVLVTRRAAEMIKYAANSFLATKIAFANEMAGLAREVGVDWQEVVQGIGLDKRIGALFLRPGIGFGGSCFPKDLAAVTHLARERQVPLTILDAVLANNARQPLEGVRLLRELLGPLRGKRIALLGLAFKDDTDDVRETRSLPLLRALEAEGADVRAYDPRATASFLAIAPGTKTVARLEDALEWCEGAIVATEWAAFKGLAEPALAGRLRGKALVDGRRILPAHGWASHDVRFAAIGLPPS